MAFASMPQPQTASAVAMAKLGVWLSGVDPVPDTLRIGSKEVVLWDLSPSILAFRQQKRLLQQIQSFWPSVELTPHTSPPEATPKLVPIDLRDVDSLTAESEHDLFVALSHGTAQARARDRVQAYGMRVGEQPVASAEQVFKDLLAEIIGRRFDASSSTAGSAPPTGNFEVTTDSHGVEVVYADGYFVSTARGFGYSTPAKKALAYGCYTFGYNTPVGPDFLSGTTWTVPTDSHAHLRV